MFSKKNEMFSVRTKRRGDFQFRLLISRHIRYIEGFRRGIIKGDLIDLNETEKVILNLYLINIIEEYLDLYTEKINEMSKALGYKIESGILYITCLVHRQLKTLVEQIIETGGEDFDTIINTDKEFMGSIRENYYTKNN